MEYLTDASRRSARTVWQYTAGPALPGETRTSAMRSSDRERWTCPSRQAACRPGSDRARSARARRRRSRLTGCCAGSNAIETFFVARTVQHGVAGLYVTSSRPVDPALLREDPVTAAWCAHLDANPVLPHERVLFCRRWLTRKSVKACHPCRRLLARLQAHVHGKCGPTASRLRSRGRYRLLRAARDAAWLPADRRSAGLPGRIDVLHPMSRLRPKSVDGWLSRVVGLSSPASRVRRQPRSRMPLPATARFSAGSTPRARGREAHQRHDVSYFSPTPSTPRIVADGPTAHSQTIKELWRSSIPSMFLQMHRGPS